MFWQPNECVAAVTSCGSFWCHRCCIARQPLIKGKNIPEGLFFKVLYILQNNWKNALNTGVIFPTIIVLKTLKAIASQDQQGASQKSNQFNVPPLQKYGLFHLANPLCNFSMTESHIL